MALEVDIQVLDARLAGIQEKVDAIHEMLTLQSIEEKSIGDWIPESLATELSGLKRSSLFALRKAGKLTSSRISGKGVFYRRSDFEKILNDNEKNM